MSEATGDPSALSPSDLKIKCPVLEISRFRFFKKLIISCWIYRLKIIRSI